MYVYLYNIKSFLDESQDLFKNIAYPVNTIANQPNPERLEDELFSQPFQTAEGEKYKTLTEFIDFELSVARLHRIPVGMNDLQLKDSVSPNPQLTLNQDLQNPLSQKIRNLEYLLTTPGIVSLKSKDLIYELLQGWYKQNNSVSPLLDYQDKVRTEIVSDYERFKSDPNLENSVTIICDQMWQQLSKKYAGEFSNWPTSVQKKYKNILYDQLMKITIVLFVNQSRILNPNGPIDFLTRSQLQSALKQGIDFSLLSQKLYGKTSCFGAGLILEQLRCLGVNAFYSVPLSDKEGRLRFVDGMAHVRPAIALTGKVFYEIEPESFDTNAEFKIKDVTQPYALSEKSAVYRMSAERTVYKAYFHALAHYLDNLVGVHPYANKKTIEQSEIVDPSSWRIHYTKGLKSMEEELYLQALREFKMAQQLNPLELGSYGNLGVNFARWISQDPNLLEVDEVFDQSVLPVFFHSDYFNAIELLLANQVVDGATPTILLRNERLNPQKLLVLFQEQFNFMREIYELLQEHKLIEKKVYQAKVAKIHLACAAVTIQLEMLSKKFNLPFVVDLSKLQNHSGSIDLDWKHILPQWVQTLGLNNPYVLQNVKDFMKKNPKFSFGANFEKVLTNLIEGQ